MTTIVTSWGPHGWTQYASKFCRTFEDNWPASVDLVCYVEEPVSVKRAELRDLMSVHPCRDFLRRHKDNLTVQGKVQQPCWKSNERAQGNSYRTNAYKFGRKTFAIRDAALKLGTGILCWMDADVVTTHRVPEDWLADLLPSDTDCAYLGRPGSYSECGFIAFRLPQSMPLIERWTRYYEADEFLAEREWHDSWLFDRARERCPSVRCHNITPNGRRHVWHESPLTRWADHMKGAWRKELGHSPERFTPEARAFHAAR